MTKFSFLFLSAVTMACLIAPAILAAGQCDQTLQNYSFKKAPDHFISYQDELAPEWKKVWDQARLLYQQKKYGQARIQYELLLSRKDNIDQARWEYVSVLMCLHQWQKAGSELTVLIGNNPDRFEYMLARAEISLASKEFASAEDIYAVLYKQKSRIADCNSELIRILSGYISALEGTGKIKVLLPYIEHLMKLQPEDLALKKKAADIAIQTGQSKRALVLLRSLEENNPEDCEVLERLARVYELTEDYDTAATYWQRVVALDRENIEAHEQLIAYYQSDDNASMQLKHVEALLLLTPNDSKLLEQGAQLNVTLERPDLALEYYNLLLSLHPTSEEIMLQKKMALQELAAQLLALIENSGSHLLWEDLVKVTVDRTEVYQTIADMLRKQGRRNELIEVLVVFHNEVPGDIGIRDELVALLKEQDRGDFLAPSRDSNSSEPVVISQ